MKTTYIIFCFSVSMATSIDCPDVINFALGLNLDLINPTVWNQLQGDCCVAAGITCLTQRITKIEWINFGFNGTINGTALPLGLKTLDISGGKITGSVPLFPDTVTLLVLKNNLLSGPFPPFPSGLIYLYINGNRLTGPVPNVPNTIHEFYIGVPGEGNYFTGSIALYRPKYVFITDNLITNITITDTSVLGTMCNLSNNPLLGNPNLAALTMCGKSNLYVLTTTTRRITSSVAMISSNIFSSKQLLTTTLPVTSSTSQPVSSKSTPNLKISSVLPTSSISVSLKNIKSYIQMGSTIPIESTLLSEITYFSDLYSHTFSQSSRIIYKYLDTSSTLIKYENTQLQTYWFLPVYTTFMIITIVSKFIISISILCYVVKKSPFKRELRKKLKAKMISTNGNDFEGQ